MPVTLLCFPAGDAAFCDVAHRCLAALGERPTPEMLEGALRRIYPLVAARSQHPAASLGFGQRWYVYRDGRLGRQDLEAWWEDPLLPRVAIDQTNRYTAANDAACALLQVPSGTLIGRSWEEFAEPPAAVAAEDLRRSLQRLGHGDSTFRLIRSDGGRVDIDYHTVVYVSGPEIVYETVMRERPTDVVDDGSRAANDDAIEAAIARADQGATRV